MMLFEPQCYRIPDRAEEPFIDPQELNEILLSVGEPSLAQVREVIDVAMSRKRLSVRQTAVLLCAGAPAQEAIFQAAKQLKKEVYGERIVLFAPLYVGNQCINNCAYCGFRAENQQAVRKTLSREELTSEVEALQRDGHKRLILVYGEHARYNAEKIAADVKQAYRVKTTPHGEIRRININAAPLSREEFEVVARAGIGTYQIFQETYHPVQYAAVHPRGPKSDYSGRLTALDRAMQAGIDDVGLGVLLGLADWRFEVLALVRHTNHLEACFGVGPHTISFPRLKDASALEGAMGRFGNQVDDEAFKQLIAILRLAVPYAGLILTAREPGPLRDELIAYGVSQIDAGSQLEIGGYSEHKDDINKAQFALGDERSLAQMVTQLLDAGQIPSFCTACYRKGRTGEHFMEFSTQGFIKRFCTPNALLTFAEYLQDYAHAQTYEKGWQVIENHLSTLENQAEIASRLERIRVGERDLLY